MDFSSLKSIVNETSALISQFQNPTNSPAPVHHMPDREKNENHSINALDLAHDAASLIRAHSTKLSLLMINKPFTPTAIAGVLREMMAGPLPALATTLELCDEATYTKTMQSELKWRVNRVYAELSVLIKEIPLSAELLRPEKMSGAAVARSSPSLTSTGIVWRACDELKDLKTLGIAGLMIQKAEQYRETLKDAIAELQEWGEDESDDEQEDQEDDKDEDDENDNAHEVDATQDAIDQLFHPTHHIPRIDTAKVRPRLESSLRRLKLMVLMYQAVVKRRLKTLPALLPYPDLPPKSEKLFHLRAEPSTDPRIVPSLDALMEVLGKIPDVADELASRFYELDVKGIDERMDECFFTGFAAVELVLLSWEDKRDEFSTWVGF